MKTERKTILLTNDDGIDAEGIYSLYRTFKKDGRFDLRVVAPDKESSAVGHAITVFRPISVIKNYQEGEFFGYAVDGTPADCVKLAIGAILDRPPDLLISGINRGPNMGENIIYSGTVSAATEGTVCGVSSIALSADDLQNPDYSYASGFALRMATKILENGGLPGGTLLNINIPSLEKDKIKGVKLTVQSDIGFKDNFVKRQDPRGRDYYWMDGVFLERNVSEDSDYNAVKNGYVSVTPIHYDMTDYKSFDHFKGWNMEKLK
ncbi:MAG: 5'/3'-nucleotidase SurE [Actinobacteria bacterium]|nr:5'/3'-nucleotidase SurE [Actinomycetota bacterium]